MNIFCKFEKSRSSTSLLKGRYRHNSYVLEYSKVPIVEEEL
jgi:hypothetical protein